MKIITIMLLLATFLPVRFVLAQQQNEDWSQIDDIKTIVKTSQLMVPQDFSLYKLADYQATFDALQAAPPRFDQEGYEDVLFTLPLPDNGFGTFRVLHSPIMEAPLRNKFPTIQTYSLVGVTNPHARAKIDFGPKGFHAMIRSAGESAIFIDPYRVQDHFYMVYKKSDYPSDPEKFVCQTEASIDSKENTENNENRSVFGDCSLREYRLALACSGEYGTFHGGTKSSVMAAMVTSMNRVNGIFEDDAGITMKFVANNDTLIYLDSLSDPYTNSDGTAMLAQNQAVCDLYIGTGNYDIGHVFSTGGGGVAYLRSPCSSSNKAGGVTGRGAPINDPFDVDYVAHEMGHQFGGNHTQNNSCQRSAKSYEPGSASTIMGYAGICTPNVQSNSDPYYHATTLEEFGDFVTNNSTGGSCSNVLSTLNNGPTADAGANYVVPMSTPFTLTGVGSDPIDGDPITYCWEHYENDISNQPPESTSTSGPNFRSLLPSVSPSRDFPAMGVENTWEVLSEVARTMDFKLTVRDNSALYGYGCTAADDMTVEVITTAGPFAVTSPNGGENWIRGATDTVTWNVANTDMVPINVNQVDIFLSIDSGVTYPYQLAANEPNDGSASVIIPNILSTTARIRIQAVGNIVFDVSDDVFTIREDVICVDYTSTDVPVSIEASPPGGPYFSDLYIPDVDSIFSVQVIDVIGTHSYTSDLTFSLLDSAGQEVRLLTRQCGSDNNFDFNFTDGGDSTVNCPLNQGQNLNPEEALADYIGMKGNGNWQLKIIDPYDNDGGQLTGWGLKICYYNTIPDPGGCDNTLVFDSSPLASGTYIADQSVTLAVPLENSAIVVLRAGDFIELVGGAEVLIGSELETNNAGCP